jgi:hypothetical protein
MSLTGTWTRWLAAVVAIAAVGAVAMVVRSRGSEPTPQYEIAMSGGPGAEMIDASTVSCPTAGVGGAASALPSAGGVGRMNLTSNQVIPYRVAITSVEAPDNGAVTLDLAFTRSVETASDRSPGFDAEAAVICAFIVDEGAAGTASVELAERPASPRETTFPAALEVRGLPPNGTVTAEVWVVTPSLLTPRVGAVVGSIVAARTLGDAPSEIALAAPAVATEVGVDANAAQGPAQLDVSDGGRPVARGAAVPYRVGITARDAGVPVTDVVLEAKLQGKGAFALPPEVAPLCVVDAAKTTATCTIKTIEAGARVELQLPVLVAADAGFEATGEDVCTENGQDLCLSVDLLTVEGRDPESAVVSEASDVDPPQFLTVRRTIKDGRTALHIGDPVTFQYLVSAMPQVPALTKVELIDPGCEPTIVGGDANRNRALDPGEVWEYKCILSSIEGRLDPVQVVARTADGTVHRGVDPNVPRVIDPELTIVARPASGAVSVSVRNSGDDPLTRIGVACGTARPPEAVPARLDIGASADFTCPAGTRRVTALAVDSLGKPVAGAGNVAAA